MKTRLNTIGALGACLVLASASGAEFQATPIPTLQLPAGQAPVAAATRPYLSAWATEVAKLAQAGIDDSVTLSFVTNSAGTFNLASDQIIYLRDSGVSNDVISAMLQHDLEIASGWREVPASTAPISVPAITFTFAPPATNSVVSSSAISVSSTEAATVLASAPAPSPVSQMTPQTAQVTDVTAPAASKAICQAAPTQVCARDRACSQQDELYRVRAPYAVQLTAPIIVLRGEGRPANSTILEIFH